MAEVKSRVPGKMIEVNVKVGDVVKAKDILGTMEAMKMKQPISAPVDGTVKEVVYPPTSIKNGSIKIEGKVNLTDSQWNDADLSSHHFFRLRVIIR